MKSLRAATLALVATISTLGSLGGSLGCDKPRGTEPGLGIKPEPPAERRSLRAAFESLPRGGKAQVTPLYTNVDAWAARWHVMHGAQDSIDVVTFILHDDLFGRAFLGLLARKADEGVRVRLLVDSTGTMHANDDRIDPKVLAALDRRDNVDVRSYNPLTKALPDVAKDLSLLPVAAANHDKILVVDGRKSIIGGRNFADEYFADPADDPVVFHDKDVLLESKDVAAGLRTAFEREWFDASTEFLVEEAPPATGGEADLLSAAKLMDEAMSAEPLADAALPAPAVASREAPVPKQRTLPDDDAQALLLFPRTRGTLRAVASLPTYEGEVRVLDSCSQAGCRKNDINEGLIRLVESAREEIVIENPYLMLSSGGLAVLQHAAARGVRITLLTNSPVSSDNAVTQAFFLAQWPKIVAAVPTLRLFVMAESHNVHGKAVVVDGKVAAVGSYNLDVLSASMNSEIVSVVWSESFAKATREHILKTIALGAPRIREYTIARDAKGNPVVDAEGAPVITYGAHDHCDPNEWTQLMLLQKAMALREPMPDLSPLL